MKCNDKKIKGMLPAYLEVGLGPEERLRVKRHLETCEDCRAELALLRTMADEPVPDPGGAFWQAMPERVFRAVQEEKAKRKRSAFTSLWGRPLVPRWAWATAAVGLAAVFSWLLVRPAPMDIARTGPPEDGTAYENALDAEPMNVAELSSAELSAVTQWAQNEIAPMREAVTQGAPENSQKDIYQDLMELSPQELDRVYEMLKQKEQDVREKLNKKAVKEKGLG